MRIWTYRSPPTIPLKRSIQGASHLEASSPALRKHTGVVSMMDGCPVSELLAADPIYQFHLLHPLVHLLCIRSIAFIYESIMQTQLTASMGCPAADIPSTRLGAKHGAPQTQFNSRTLLPAPCRAVRRANARQSMVVRAEKVATCPALAVKYFNACSIWPICCTSTCMRCLFMSFCCADGRETVSAQVHRHACPTHR